ncbi:hypothetical protein lerEdw1_017659 [Lerista edwardsae]|nr:hypothetical protein lerEdw1_017659 [Lerista edwardsae]
MLKRWTRDQKRKPSDVARYILKSMEEIDMLLTSGSPERSCQKAEQVLKKIQGWSDEEIPNRSELVGNLYSCIGNAQIEIGNMTLALQSHQVDLDIAKENNLTDTISRALDNIGRVYARMGSFQDAINTYVEAKAMGYSAMHCPFPAGENNEAFFSKVAKFCFILQRWEEKIPLVKSNLEKTWLFHEIGRCYLELGRAAEARDYGERSLQCAEEEGDIEWQLNAGVLVAQAQVKLEDFHSAVTYFEKALEKAKRIHNDTAQQAIIIALDEANKGFIKELKEEQTLERMRELKELEDAEEEDEEEAAEEEEAEASIKDADDSEADNAEKKAIEEYTSEVTEKTESYGEKQVSDTEGGETEIEQGEAQEKENEQSEEIGEQGETERTEDEKTEGEKMEDEKTEGEKTEDEKTEDEKTEDEKTEGEKTEDEEDLGNLSEDAPG